MCQLLVSKVVMVVESSSPSELFGFVDWTFHGRSFEKARHWSLESQSVCASPIQHKSRKVWYSVMLCYVLSYYFNL